MSDWRIKGVIDRWGGIEWILFYYSNGLAQPTAVISDSQLTRLHDDMNEQRPELDALRFRETTDAGTSKGNKRGKAIAG